MRLNASLCVFVGSYAPFWVIIGPYVPLFVLMVPNPSL